MILLPAKQSLKPTTEKYPSIEGISAAAGYKKTTENFVIQQLQKTISIAEQISTGWIVLTKRRIVQRTLAWFNLDRRLAKDYKMTTRSAAALPTHPYTAQKH